MVHETGDTCGCCGGSPLPQRTTCSVGLTKTIQGGGGSAVSFGQGGSTHLRRGGRNSQKSPETTSETFFALNKSLQPMLTQQQVLAV